MEVLLKSLKENDGATCKNYKKITYKTGYQVATSGSKTKSIAKAIKLIEKYDGNCGIWLSKGIYYIDKSKRITTKKKAEFVGKIRKQLSIWDWKNQTLIWL